MIPKPKTFHFCGYEFESDLRKIRFNYRIEFSNCDDVRFTETLILPKGSRALDHDLIRKFLDPLALILGISYYKLYCPAKIRSAIRLSKEQANFWNTVYRKGLGEFLFRNKLDPKKLAKFPISSSTSSSRRISIRERALLGIGGGKDSIVAAGLLEKHEITSLLIETQRVDPVSRRIANEIGNPVLKIRRVLDPKIFEQHVGGYNGHIPISAIYAFVGLLAAALYEYKYVIVANEHSSNFGNLRFKGEVINHQWSKSIEFEAMLQCYTRRFITPDITYFSLLRQFYEIRIAKMFARHKTMFPIFSSCNRNFKISGKRQSSLWCCKCPKCAFVFLILAPFLGKKELLGIFGTNLFTEKSLLPIYGNLLGFGDTKPFDCVGTFEESQAALVLASKKFANSVVVKSLLPKIKDAQAIIDRVLRTVPARTLPTEFRFLGIRRVCILGYGKEGRVSEEYVRRKYPNLELGVLDRNSSDSYLEQQRDFDLAIKTPGIPMSKIEIPYVTATNLFFSQNTNLTVGVTGSKGKSTTSSLIYEILKYAGKKARLIGNIGDPMLGVCLTEVEPDEIFVIELSSYMLEDIEYSPDIALLLNLFPEHMDYHGSVRRYYKAKRNIFRFQKPGDTAIKPPFPQGAFRLTSTDVPLLGVHNLRNIRAAIRVAKILKIPDSVILKAITAFKPLPHRLEFIGTYEGIKFYDDAISTTPQSTILAIRTLPQIGTILLGGEDRGYDFRKLEKTLRHYKVQNVVLFPDSGNRILKSRGGFNILETSSMEEAVVFAFQNTPKGKTCLLSTASPSYSLWKNFEEKGNLFQRFVKKHSRKS